MHMGIFIFLFCPQCSVSYLESEKRIILLFEFVWAFSFLFFVFNSFSDLIYFNLFTYEKTMAPENVRFVFLSLSLFSKLLLKCLFGVWLGRKYPEYMTIVHRCKNIYLIYTYIEIQSTRRYTFLSMDKWKCI